MNWKCAHSSQNKKKIERERQQSAKINRVWRFCFLSVDRIWERIIINETLNFSFERIFFSFIYKKKLTCFIVSFIGSSATSNCNKKKKVQGSERRDVLDDEEEELCIPNDARKWRFNLKQIKYKSKKIMQNTVVFWLAGAVQERQAWMLKKKN